MVGSQMIALAGTAGLFYIINWLLSNRKKFKTSGKVVLITGANSGLGKECARIFFNHGCCVIMAGRNMSLLQQAKDEIIKQSNNSKFQNRLSVLQVDLCNIDSMERVATQAAEMYGTIDILINNAGISYRGCIQDTNMDVHMQLMTVNYFGQIALTKAVLPYMQKTGEGHIVAVSTVQGRISQAYRSAYAASKHALQAYFDCLRAEVACDNIHVCVVSPGYIQTNLSKNAMCGDGSKYGAMDATTAEGLPPEKVAQVILHAVQCNQTEIIPAKLTYRLVIILRAICPRLVFWIMAKRAQKQRKNYIKSS